MTQKESLNFLDSIINSLQSASSDDIARMKEIYEQETVASKNIKRTRFQKEISGELGDFWKKNAENEVQKAVVEADVGAIVEDSGAIRWKKSGNYLPDDFCEKLEYAEYPFSREATERARNAQIEEQLAEYREKAKGSSSENIEEARAAFGTGTTVVNIITGETIKL